MVIRIVGDTLVLAKVGGIDNIKQFDSFDKNIQFTIDRFESGIVRFGDIKISFCEIDLYYRTTHTGQYSDFSSQKPWKFKIFWIKVLRDYTRKIFSSNKLRNDQSNWVRTFISLDSFTVFR